MKKQRKNRILIVDDNQDIHNDIKKILSSSANTSDLDALVKKISGYSKAESDSLDIQIDSALQGDDGVAMVRQAILDGNPYALVFVDIRIPPGLDGVQTIKQLQQEDDGLQYVIITAYSDYSWANINAEIFPKDNLLVLKKPFDSIEIRQSASTLLEKWHLTREREEMLEELRRERDKFSDLFSVIDDGICVVNRQYGIQFINQALEEDFGPLKDLVCYEYFHARSAPCPWCKMDQIFAGKTIRWEWSLEKNGRTYDVKETPMVGQDGSLLKFMIFRDISEQKEQEELRLEIARQQEQIERIDSLKTMAGAIAHRFNNAMMVVQGNLELMMDTLLDGSKEYKLAANVAKAAGGASKVGSMMLSYVGQNPLQLQILSLPNLVRESVTALKDLVPPSISLKICPPEQDLYCSIDQAQIKEVLESVLTNAIESLDNDKGTITITFGSEYCVTSSFPLPFHGPDIKDGIYSFCRIEDTGHGIALENMLRIFEPFYTTRFVGRGFGLALSVGVMRSHHGALTVESSPDKGTTVRVLLPSIDPSSIIH